MRKFTTLTVDSYTGYNIVLSECSYNMAMDWLNKEIQKSDAKIFRIFKVVKGIKPLMRIEVGVPHYGKDIMGGTNVYYGLCRNFYYDEDRGYLLKDF